MTPHAPRFVIPILSTCNLLIGMGAFVIIGVLEPMGADLNRPAADLGQLLTVYALAYAVLSPVLVSLSGHIGRRRVMAFGLVLFLIASVISALAPSLLVLNGARIIAAAGAGLFTPVAAAVAAGLFPPEQRAKVLAAVFFGFTLSQIAGVPLSSWIAYSYGWRYAFWLVIALNIPCIALIWHFVPAGLSFQPVSLHDLRQTLAQGRMMLAIFFTSSYLGAVYVLYTYLAPLLSQSMGYGRDGITFVLFIGGIGAVMGNVLGGMMADRFGWLFTLTLLCIAQMLLMPLYSLFPISTLALISLSIAWSVAGWAFMAGQQMRLIDLAGNRATVVLALNAAAIYIGAAAGSAVGGIVIARFGIQSIGVAAGLCATIALANLWLSARFAPKAHVAS